MVALRQENAALREEISLAEAQARSAAKPGVGPDETAAGRLAREFASLKEALARAEAKLADPGGEIEKLQRQPKAARTQAQNERLIWLEPHVLNATIKNQFSILSSQAALPKLVFNARPSHIHGHVAGNRFPAQRSPSRCAPPRSTRCGAADCGDGVGGRLADGDADHWRRYFGRRSRIAKRQPTRAVSQTFVTR